MRHEHDEKNFREELRAILNRHSRENDSNTPDFILAVFLSECLAAFDRAVTHRTKWYSKEGVSPSEITEFDTLPRQLTEDEPRPRIGQLCPECGHPKNSGPCENTHP